MSDFDFSPRGPLLLGMATDAGVHWVTPANPVRVRGSDLRQVAGRTSAARRADPGAEVVVDIEFVIAADERSARALAPADRGGDDDPTIRYVGTPAGLAGLVADLRAIDIADGAVLIPLTTNGDAEFYDAVLPVLATMTRLPLAVGRGRTA